MIAISVIWAGFLPLQQTTIQMVVTILRKTMMMITTDYVTQTINAKLAISDGDQRAQPLKEALTTTAMVAKILLKTLTTTVTEFLT